MSLEFTPSDIAEWQSPKAVRQTFSELGLNPDSTPWFDIKSTNVGSISEFDTEFTGDHRCTLVLHENLETAWLVGFISRPIGTPSTRYYRFEPDELIESKTALRKTLDRLNALDPESPQSIADALSKSELNNRFSNTVSVLFQNIANNIQETYELSNRRTKDFSNALLLTGLRAKVLAENPAQVNEPFRKLFIKQIKDVFSTNNLQGAPETLKPVYREVLSTKSDSIVTVPDAVTQRDFLDSIFESFERSFEQFEWHLSDNNWSQLHEVTSHTIGIALERHLTEQQGEGYQTPPELTGPVAEESIVDVIVDQLNSSCSESYTNIRDFLEVPLEFVKAQESINLDKNVPNQNIAAKLGADILPELRVVDPAMGSGAFLLSALDMIVRLRQYINSTCGEIQTSESYECPDCISNQTPRGQIVWTSISQNLFGVDIDPVAVSLTRFRLELAYICTLNEEDEFIPPRFGHNFKCGNSIIGKPYSSDPPYWSGQLPLKAFRGNQEQYIDHLQAIASSSSLANEIKPILTQYRTAQSEESRRNLSIINKKIEEESEEFNAQLKFELYKEGGGGKTSEYIDKEKLSKKDAFHWPVEFPCIMDEGGFDVVLFHSPWSEPNIYKSLDDSIQSYLYSGSQYQLPPAKGWRRTTDTIDAFFLHRAHDIISKRGIIASLVDESVLTTPASHHVRARYLTALNIDRIANFINQNTFEEIDRRFKYAVLISKANQKNSKINIGSGFITPEDFTNNNKYYEIDAEFISQFSPKTLVFPQIESDIQLEALDRILAAPTLSENEAGAGWTVNPTGEFNQTTDSEYISDVRFKDSDPIYRGANIYQYVYQTAPEATVDKPDLWTIPREAEQGLSTREYLEERKRMSSTGKLPVESSRIVYRRITSPANERSMVACLLPPDHFHINSLNSIDPYQGDQTDIKYRLVLLGLLNSIPYDYLFRQKITNSVPKYVLFETRVPFITEEHELFEPILTRVGTFSGSTTATNEIGEKLARSEKFVSGSAGVIRR